jgi:hypothetical protein
MSPVTQTLEPPSTIQSGPRWMVYIVTEDLASPRRPHTLGVHTTCVTLSGMEMRGAMSVADV